MENSQKLIDALRDAGHAVRSYSGRGMHGRECVAVVLEWGVTSFEVGVELAQALPDDVAWISRLDVREEAYGFETLLYFPTLVWPEGCSNDEA